MPGRRPIVFAGALALLPLAGLAAAPVRGSRPTTPVTHWFGSDRPDARDYFGDHELQTHDGRTVRFFSDLLLDRTVLVNVVATQCRGVCKTTTHRLALARDALGVRFGREVHFVTISSDPVRDTVEALRQFARAHGVDGPGWTFVTGPSANLEQVLGRFGHRLMPEHMQFGHFALGNVPASRWTRVKADAAPRTVAERLSDLADVRLT
jgi:protein SCO1